MSACIRAHPFGTALSCCEHDNDRWTVELDFSTGEEELLFGLTIVAGETFASMHDAASAVADAIELDLRLARGCVRH